MITGSGKPIPLWRSEKANFCERISRERATLKILLKTKDEPERLATWIEHHAGIVGLENLIIFDNMSTSDAVHEIYFKFRDTIPVIQFDEFLDLPHNTAYFGEIYAALAKSCDFFVFLDTDEYLTLYTGDGRFNWDDQILEFLCFNSKTLVFPGCWLPNQKGHHDRFKLAESGWPLHEGLQWGKPVISSSVALSGIVQHNTQIDHGYYKQSLVTNLFILHRTNACADERIRVNIQKMISYGMLKPGDGLDEVIAMNLDEFPEVSPKRYCLEIREYLTEEQIPLRPEGNSFSIRSDGLISWRENWQENLINSFIHEPHRFSGGLFSPLS